MRRHCRLIAVIAAALLLSAPALAQFRGGFGGGLAGNASVQKELKLTDDQVEKVKSALKEVGSSLKDSRPGKDATPEQRAEFIKKVSEATNKALAGILKPEQIKRLKQIELQQSGPSDADAQKELALSDEQKTKIKELADKLREQSREVFKNAQGNFEEARDKLTKLRKETQEKELGVLTDTQKKKWKELTGEPFEVKFEPRAKNQN
jgi:Spy/CpxP family protein refolding chaperone